MNSSLRSRNYTLIDLGEQSENGHKWLFGPFQPEESDRYSAHIEIGFVDLQEVEETDRLHFHQECEEYYVILNGWMQIQIEESVLEVSDGQILLVQPGVSHLILEVQPNTRILLIKVPPGLNDKIIVAENDKGG